MDALPLANANKFRVLVLKSFISRDPLIKKTFFSETNGLAMKDICDIYHYTQRYYMRQTLACIGKAVVKECLSTAHAFVSETSKLGALMKCMDPRNISVDLSEDEKYALLVSAELDEKELHEKEEKKSANLFLIIGINICKDMLSLQLESLNASILETLQSSSKQQQQQQQEDEEAEQLTQLCTTIVEQDDAERGGAVSSEAVESNSNDFLSKFEFETTKEPIEKKEVVEEVDGGEDGEVECTRSSSPLADFWTQSNPVASPEVGNEDQLDDEDILAQPFFNETFEDDRYKTEQKDLLEMIQGRTLKRGHELEAEQEEGEEFTNKKVRRKRQKKKADSPLELHVDLE